MEMSIELAKWLQEWLPKLAPGNVNPVESLKIHFSHAGIPEYADWDSFFASEIGLGLREAGLLVL